MVVVQVQKNDIDKKKKTDKLDYYEKNTFFTFYRKVAIVGKFANVKRERL